MKTKRILIQLLIAATLILFAFVIIKTNKHRPEETLYSFGHSTGRFIESIVIRNLHPD